jgi:lipopolysaccharide export system permease protein
METRREIRNLPLGSIIDGYLSQAFLRVFFFSLLIATSLYIIVDFFDRISMFFASAAAVGSVLRYFIYSAPLAISRVIAFATLFSTLFCLSMAARTNEITALRSSGISVQRIALPLLILSVVICLSTFFWNEALVPIFAHQAQNIYRTEIQRKQQQSLFGTHDIWVRGKGNFTNIGNFDARTNVLEHVTVFLLNRDFTLRGLIEIPRAQWSGHDWDVKEAIQWNILADGKVENQKTTAPPAIAETPDDLKLLARDPEEFSFFDLERQISEMKAKGIDTTSDEVDLHTKLALPFISPLMVLLATPFALKKQMSAGLALSFGAAMLLGFGYWVLTAFCISLGHSGTLPPRVAAWLPNTIFVMVGFFYFTAEE